MAGCLFNHTKKELEGGCCQFCSVLFCDVRYENKQIARTDNKIIEKQKKITKIV